MPGQVFQVVQCYSCHTFQVQQRKKVNKWVCKMCGEKQSIKKIYGEGSGADCRVHVQKLNTLRGDLEQSQPQQSWAASSSPSDGQQDTEYSDEPRDCPIPSVARENGGLTSKWGQYLEEPESLGDEDAGNVDDAEWTTDRQLYQQACKQHRKRKKAQVWQKNPDCYGHDDFAEEYAEPPRKMPSNSNWRNQSSSSSEVVKHFGVRGHLTHDSSSEFLPNKVKDNVSMVSVSFPKAKSENSFETKSIQKNTSFSSLRANICGKTSSKWSTFIEDEDEEEGSDGFQQQQLLSVHQHQQDEVSRLQNISRPVTDNRRSKWSSFVDGEDEDENCLVFAKGDNSDNFSKPVTSLSLTAVAGRNISPGIAEKVDCGSFGFRGDLDILSKCNAEKSDSSIGATISWSNNRKDTTQSVLNKFARSPGKENTGQKPLFNVGDIDDDDLDIDF